MYVRNKKKNPMKLENRIRLQIGLVLNEEDVKIDYFSDETNRRRYVDGLVKCLNLFAMVTKSNPFMFAI